MEKTLYEIAMWVIGGAMTILTLVVSHLFGRIEKGDEVLHQRVDRLSEAFVKCKEGREARDQHLATKEEVDKVENRLLRIEDKIDSLTAVVYESINRSGGTHP